MVEQFQQPIAPVNHSGLSAATTTVAGAGVGAVKGGFKWGAKWIGALAAVGAGLGLIASSSVTLPAFAVTMLWGAVFGGTVGVLSSPVAAGFGALFGGAKGAGQAHSQVKMEKASAQAMNMQLEAYKYNAMAQAAANQQNTTVYAPSATSNVMPTQGSAMNAAAPQISGAQYDGLVNGQQLAAVR
jgi:hypothetical protein